MDKPKNAKNNGKNEAFRAIVNQLGGHVSGYVPELCKLFGVKAGLMLSQLLYWQVRYPGEFYLSIEELYQQTGLNAEEQRNARERLVNTSIVTATLKGFPRTWYYQVDIASLIEQCSIGGESQSMGKSMIEKVHRIDGESPSPLMEKVHDYSWRKSTTVNMNHKITTLDYNIRLTPPPPSEIENFDAEEEEQEEEVNQGIWLSESFLDDCRNFGIFENNLKEVESAIQSGWSEDTIRDLMRDVEDDYLAGRIKSKPGTLLHRLRNLKPPKPKVNKYAICPYCGEYPCVCEEL